MPYTEPFIELNSDSSSSTEDYKTPIHKTPSNNENLIAMNLSSPLEFGGFLYCGISADKLEQRGSVSLPLGYLGSIEFDENLCLSMKAILFTFSRKKIQESVNLVIYNSGLAIQSSAGSTLAVYPANSLILFAYFGIQVRHLVLVVIHRENNTKKCMSHLLFDEYNPQNPIPVVNSPVFYTISDLFSLFNEETVKMNKFFKKMGFILGSPRHCTSHDTCAPSISSAPCLSESSPISDFYKRMTTSVLQPIRTEMRFPIIRNHVAERGVQLLHNGLKTNVSSCYSGSMEYNLESHVEVTFPDLRTVLQDSAMCKLFEEFCVGEFSQENVKFWKRVEKYHKINNPEKRHFEALTMYRKFIQSDCQYDLNLLPSTIKDIYEGLWTCVPTLFDEAQREIYTLMNDDTFERFRQSNYAENVLSIEKKRKKSQTMSSKQGNKTKWKTKFLYSPKLSNSLPRSFK